jgi:hypothetical protein
MNQELAAARKFQCPKHRHPQYVDSRMNDLGNLNRLLSYKRQNPNARLILAGIPNAPLNLDPPGTGSPFDTLKHPKSLIARLNRLPEDPDGLPYGWDEETLRKITHNIVAKLSLKTLRALPESVRASLPSRLLARDPEDPPAFPTMPVINRPARKSQRVSAENEGMPYTDNSTAIHKYSPRNKRTPVNKEEILDSPEQPAVSRSTRGRERMTSDEQTSEINDMSAPEHSPLPQSLPQPPTLRRRGKVRHACDNCRRKKFRCDGIYPSCNSCDASGVQCSYGVRATLGGDRQSLLAEG